MYKNLLHVPLNINSPVLLSFVNQAYYFIYVCNNMFSQFVNIHTQFTVFTNWKTKEVISEARTYEIRTSNRKEDNKQNQMQQAFIWKS